MQLIPSLIATGSAPQMPIRQPASIGMPLASAISSSAHAGLGRDALVVGEEGDLRGAAGDRADAAGAGERGGDAGRRARGGGAAGARSRLSRNGFSLRIVRTNQVAASAIAAARSA